MLPQAPDNLFHPKELCILFPFIVKDVNYKLIMPESVLEERNYVVNVRDYMFNGAMEAEEPMVAVMYNATRSLNVFSAVGSIAGKFMF